MSVDPGRPEGRAILAEGVLWFLAAIAFLLWFGFATPPTPGRDGLGGDGHIYVAMMDRSTDVEYAEVRAKYERRAGLEEYSAEEERYVRGLHWAPYCWRVLSPWIAAQIPLEPLPAFRSLGFVAHLVTLMVFWRLLRSLGASRTARILAGLFYVLSFGLFRVWARLPCYIDPLTQTFWIAGITLMVERRYRWIPLVLALGALQKESLLMLVPVVLVHRLVHLGLEPRRDLLYLSALVLPAAAVVALLRWAIPAVNFDFDSLQYWWVNVRSFATHREQWPKFVLSWTTGLGALLLMALVCLPQFLRFLRAEPTWVALALVGAFALFGGSDLTRIYLYGAPVLAIFVARWWDEDTRLRPSARWLWIVLSLGLHLYLGAHLRPWIGGTLGLKDMLPGLSPLPRVQRDLIWAAWAVGPWLLASAAILIGGRAPAPGEGPSSH